MKQEIPVRKIAFILAHPDDEHVPFGLPAQLSQDGNDVHLLAITKGDLGSHRIFSRRHIARIRAKEFAASGKLLNATTKILGFSDGILDTQTQRARMELLKELRKLKPDIIILPNRHDYHRDHVLGFEIGQWTAFHLPDGPIKTRRGLLGKTIPAWTKPVSVYEMDTQGSQTWESLQEDIGANSDHLAPVNMIIPITSEAIKKSLAAFQQHKSQLSPRPDGQLNYPELAKLGAMRRGKQIGSEYGAGLTFIPFGGYAFSTENKLREIYSKNEHFLFDKV